jgi:hypothetical protein
MAVKTIILPALLALFTLSSPANQPNDKPWDSASRRGEIASLGDIRPERYDARPAARGQRDTRDIRLAARGEKDVRDARPAARESRSNRLQRSV